jgi:hypothetical protein
MQKDSLPTCANLKGGWGLQPILLLTVLYNKKSGSKFFTDLKNESPSLLYSTYPLTGVWVSKYSAESAERF